METWLTTIAPRRIRRSTLETTYVPRVRTDRPLATPAPFLAARLLRSARLWGDRHRDDCPPGCTRHVRACPQRTGGGLRLTELKSEKSRRTIALPLQLVAALKTHRATQLHEHMIAGSTWHDGDFVWCQPNGRPIGAHADWDEWNALLKAAAIRRVRVHDARHTAARLLLAQGVDQRVVMEILGHSQISMTSRYAHVLPHVMADAAQRIGQALSGEM
jgi:hypothetical protein